MKFYEIFIINSNQIIQKKIMKLTSFNKMLPTYPKLGGINLYNEAYKRHLNPLKSKIKDQSDNQKLQDDQKISLKQILGQTLQNFCSNTKKQLFLNQDYKRYQNRGIEQLQNILNYFKNSQFQTKQFIKQFQQNSINYSKEHFLNFSQVFQKFNSKWPQKNLTKIKFIEKIKPFLKEFMMNIIHEETAKFQRNLKKAVMKKEQASQTSNNYIEERNILKKNLQEKKIEYHALYEYKKNIIEEKNVADRMYIDELQNKNVIIDKLKKEIVEKGKEISSLKKHEKQICDKLFKNLLKFHPYNHKAQTAISESTLERLTSKSSNSDADLYENIFYQNKIIQNLRKKLRKNQKNCDQRCLTSISMLLENNNNDYLQNFVSKSTKQIILEYWKEKQVDQERQLKNIIKNKHILKLLKKFNFKIVKQNNKSSDNILKKGDQKSKSYGKMYQPKKMSVFKIKSTWGGSFVKQSLQAQFPELRDDKEIVKKIRLNRVDSFQFDEIQQQKYGQLILEQSNDSGQQNINSMHVSDIFKKPIDQDNNKLAADKNLKSIQKNDIKKIAQKKVKNIKFNENRNDKNMKRKTINKVDIQQQQNKNKKVHFNFPQLYQKLEINSKQVHICISNIQQQQANISKKKHKKYKSNIIDSRNKNKSQKIITNFQQILNNMKSKQFKNKQLQVKQKINLKRQERNTIKKQSILNMKRQSIFSSSKQRFTLKDTTILNQKDRKINLSDHKPNRSLLQRISYKSEDQIEPQMLQKIQEMVDQCKTKEQFIKNIQILHQNKCGPSCPHITRYLAYFEQLQSQNKKKKSIKINIQNLNQRFI